MKPRFFLHLSLLSIFLASCAPATATVNPASTVTVVIKPTETHLQLPTETVLTVSNETPTPAPLPIATSRGPNLEATDPATVNLTSGGLQFVEFFRFT